jgi:hypothetical protein
MRKTPEERFWKYVRKTDSCWDWSGAKTAFGYSLFNVDSKNVSAHRFSYELAKGPIPAGADIDHICHNTSCVNPEHLRAASRKQNTEHRKGAQVNSKTGVRGVYFEKQSNSYIAIVNHNSKRHYVGSFQELDKAAEAVKAKRLELFTHNDLDRKVA